MPAYIPLMNVDTDMIIPKQFLKTIKRTGLGKSLFYEMRYDENQKRVLYEPVEIDPRINSPKVIRQDNRYLKDTNK